MCNVALDEMRSFRYTTEVGEKVRGNAVNGLAYSDGACRKDGHSSFGWVMYAVSRRHGKWIQVAVEVGAELVVGNHASALTEAWGLERSLERLDYFTSCPPGPSVPSPPCGV